MDWRCGSRGKVPAFKYQALGSNSTPPKKSSFSKWLSFYTTICNVFEFHLPDSWVLCLNNSTYAIMKHTFFQVSKYIPPPFFFLVKNFVDIYSFNKHPKEHLG
jgi:hypothetical protein